MEKFLEGFINFISKFGVIGLSVLSFAESSFFPVPPDVVLIPMMFVNKSLAFFYAAATTIFSVLGGLFGYLLGNKLGRPFLKRWFSEEKIKKVEDYFNKYSGWAVAIAGFTPIPYKIFTISAGVFRIRKNIFIIASIIGRGMRFFLEAILIFFLKDADKFIKSNFEYITIGISLIFLLTFYLVKVSKKRLIISETKFVLKLKKIINNVNEEIQKYSFIEKVGYYMIATFLLSLFILMIIFDLIEDHSFYLFEKYDVYIYNSIVSLRSPALNNFFKAITFLGNFWTVLILTLIVTIILLVKHYKKLSLYFGANIFLVWIFNEYLKSLFKRPRPSNLRLIDANGYSFPSGHAMIFLTLSLFLIFIINYVFKFKYHNLYEGLILLLALLVGFSRIYLGVHYLSDVLAGWIVAVVYYSASIILLRSISRRGYYK